MPTRENLYTTDHKGRIANYRSSNPTCPSHALHLTPRRSAHTQCRDVKTSFQARASIYTHSAVAAPISYVRFRLKYRPLSVRVCVIYIGFMRSWRKVPRVFWGALIFNKGG